MYKTICFFIISLFFVFHSHTFADNSETEIDLSSYEKHYEGLQIISPNDTYTIIKHLNNGWWTKTFLVKNSKEELLVIKSRNKDFWFAEFLDKYCVDVPDEFSDVIDILKANPKRELALGKLLDHPNLIKIIDFFESPLDTSEDIYIVLEYVKGRSLDNIEKGSLHAKDAITSAIQFCEALRYALNFNLMHMNLTDNNVIIQATSPDDEEISPTTSPWTENQPSKLTILELCYFESFAEISNKLKFNREYISALEGFETLEFEEDEEAMTLEFEQCIYFRDILDICDEILGKADDTLKFETLIEIDNEMKAMKRQYTHDFENGTNPSIHNYVDNLIVFLLEKLNDPNSFIDEN